MNKSNRTVAAIAAGICLLCVWNTTAQLPTPLIGLGFNDNSGSSMVNAGSVSATFSKTDPPSWSTNVPVSGGLSSIDFGTTTGNYYVESSAVISQLANLDSFTVTGWVNNRNSSIGSGGNRIVSWIYNGGNGVDIVYASGGTLKVGINQWPDSTTAISSTGMIPTDAAAPASNWRFFAVTYNASTSTIEFYFGDNSTLASLDKSLTYSRGIVGASIGKLAIGHFNAESSRTSRTDRMFRGLIDQVQIFGTVLSLSQIQTAQNAGGVAAPVFTSVTQSGVDIVLSGTNGPANGAYEMLRTTDVSVPLGSWQGMGIRGFDGNGNFSFTNPMVPGGLAAFYRLLVISNVPVFPPVITAQPQDVATSVGNNATFNVTATGSAPLTYRWYDNTNMLLASGSNSSLTLTNVQVGDSGTISVIVSNLLGTAQSTYATLTVTNSTQPPVILSQPTNLTVFVGQTAQFSVTATGALPLQYQWYFNPNTVLIDETNSTLTLANVQLANAGRYSVTITNPYGTTNSAFATLTVSSNSSLELIGWAALPAYGTATTTGGGNTTPQLVTDLATLRTLAGDGTPRVLLLSGTFVTGSTAIEVASNKTLRGADQNAKIQGGLRIEDRSNVIIQNLSVQGNGQGGTPADAIEVRGTHHAWFDHLTVWEGGDGNLDLTRGCDYITVSWSKFYYTNASHTHRLCTLVGGGSTHADTDWGKNNVTFHHNWYSSLVNSRMPRLLFGKGHFFNNYYNAPGNSYCIGTGSWASGLVENNYFKQVQSPHQYQDTNPSYIAASGNIYDTCTGNQHTGLGYPDNDGNDPGPWIPTYNYTLDPAANVPAMVTAGAGPQ